MTSHTTHPLTAAWLRDLELLLHGIDAGERAEVLAGVHEHLDGSLRPDASDDDVRRVLADLGSPQSVADEAYANPPRDPSAEPFGAPSRRWIAVTATALLAFVMVVLAITTAIEGLGLILMSFAYLTGPLWFAASVMVLTSRRLWTSAEKAVLVIVVPAAYIVAALTSIALLNNGLPPYLIPWIGGVVAVGGGGFLVGRTSLRGISRAA